MKRGTGVEESECGERSKVEKRMERGAEMEKRCGEGTRGEEKV